MIYSGKVFKAPFSSGSKQEHDAIKMMVKDKEYVLRRVGGNPFHDPVLEELVGKNIVCKGTINGYNLMITQIL